MEPASPSAPVRLDKWLWAARFYKTRTLATKACDLGRVEVNGQHAKPSRAVTPGVMLRIKTEGGEFEVQVLALSELRGPASIAQTLYAETSASAAARAQAREANRFAFPPVFTREGRPSKRDRRELDKLQRG
ncbi:MAG: RNA-binding S4 domain-containing protein [Bryobacterales bacterium]|nr:RNA-binding S4 domain-containing protein [Bryobacterales bacterium]